MKIKYLEVKQPIGTFYIASMDASTLARVVEVNHRSNYSDAVQRDQSKNRVNDIAKYCEDVDATFPTPIIIAVNNDANLNMIDGTIEFDEDEILGEVIDGQHRLEALKKSSYIDKFQIPVVFMFNLYPEEKAYVFSIINSKQTKVNMSLIYDLFSLSSHRSPYKTCHEIARALNKEKSSPFYNRLKMLGKKNQGQELATLSQGTFIKYMLELISRNPDQDTRRLKTSVELEENDKCILRDYFISNNDGIIYKIVFNLYSGLKNSFKEEWDNPKEYILSKSIGFGAVLKAYPEIHKIGLQESDLSQKFFIKFFDNFRLFLESKNIELTSKNFGSNEQARTKLSKLIIDSIPKN